MDRRKKMLSALSTAVIVLTGVVGLGLVLYPTVANWWNNLHQGYAIANYEHAVVEMDPHEHDDFFAAAEDYNVRLADRGLYLHLNDEETRDYESKLNVTPAGIMGIIEIPKIDVTLPIYHGTSPEVLIEAVGHIAGTSLPVGGLGTHCCVSGHRGLPSARLFSDLDTLERGDEFSITVLDRVLTYEVDQIRTVLPDEIDEIAIDPGQDYFTLVTCTPYGVNTHRLLVRGHRVGNDPGALRILADAVRLEIPLVAMLLAIPILVVALVWVMLYTGSRIRHRRAKDRASAEFRMRRERRLRRRGEDADENKHENKDVTREGD